MTTARQRRPPLPLHVVEVGALLEMPGDAEHRASSSCRCQPTLYRDMGDPTVTAWVHRHPVAVRIDRG